MTVVVVVVVVCRSLNAAIRRAVLHVQHSNKDEDDDDGDLSDVTICQSTIPTPAKHSLRQPPSETLRLQSYQIVH